MMDPDNAAIHRAIGLTNQTLCQEGDHMDSRFQEGDFQQDHREAVKDFQGVEVRLKEDFPMWNQEEETLDED